MMKKINTFIKDRKYRESVLSNHGFYRFCSDRFYLSRRYYAAFGKKINWDEPKTYNEKIQWLKLYDRNPEYIEMVDKYAVKEYVASKIGKEYIIPTIGVWNSCEDIDFEKLPERFVLKCTHDSGGLVICKEKKELDITMVMRKLKKSLKSDYYREWREWPYKNVPHRIICEPYMEDSVTGELRDYKFFCFDGVVKAMFVASDRQNKKEDTKFDFFDCDYNHLCIINGHPNAKTIPEKPHNFDLMKKLAAELSKGYPHIRVDFYEIDNKVYFGELTLYHWSGMVPFEPEEWDYIFGKWIELPTKRKK